MLLCKDSHWAHQGLYQWFQGVTPSMCFVEPGIGCFAGGQRTSSTTCTLLVASVVILATKCQHDITYMDETVADMKCIHSCLL